eukprot:s8686_g1.t1
MGSEDSGETARVVHSRAWADVEDDRRTSVLEMWKLIVLTSGKGTKARAASLAHFARWRASVGLDAAVFPLEEAEVRAASLAHFARWRASVGLDAAVFPLEEAEVYRYLCFLRSEGAPRSRAPRLREAINFAGAMLGSDVSETANSSRVQGAANPQLQAIAVRKKIPLTVAQVRGLEEFVLNSDNDLAAVLAGFALYCLHGRLRWSDAQHTESEPVLDLCEGKGFLNAQLYHHKTANRGSLARHRLLPVSCITPGLAEGSWAEAWLWRRKKLGLVASRGTPMMPRPLCFGGFDGLPLDPSLGALWLREILKECAPWDESFSWGDVATHSLKATLLSFMAKAGALWLREILKECAPWDESFSWGDVATHSLKATLLSFMAKAAAPENLRSIAGYHMRALNSSTLEYSRDTLAPSLHFLEGMLFDSSRVGFRVFRQRLRRLRVAPVVPDPPSDPESAAESIGTEGEAEEAAISVFALGEGLRVAPDVRSALKQSSLLSAQRWGYPCVPGEPGRIAEDVFRTGVAVPILGTEGDEHHAKLRRLHFEAYALTAAELKRTAESSESDLPRKVPTAELAARYDVLQARVKPLRLVDRLEPSHSLVTLAAQMLEDQRVRYIEWSKCTSRAQEINLVKEDSTLKMLQGGRTGTLKLVESSARLTAETKSDLEVMQALRRRGVAYELAAILSFEKHEELIDRLFMEYQREPMPGFHSVSLCQLQAADREVHATDKDQKADPGTLPNAADKSTKARKTRFVMPRALIGGDESHRKGRVVDFHQDRISFDA